MGAGRRDLLRRAFQTVEGEGFARCRGQAKGAVVVVAADVAHSHDFSIEVVVRGYWQ
jgi:hypothetical protein